MTKMFVAFGIAFAILVGAFGIGATIAAATDKAASQEVTSEEVQLERLVREYVADTSDEDDVWSNWSTVEIDQVLIDGSGRSDSVWYSVYDIKGNDLGGGVVSWSTGLVNYANAE